MRKLLSVISAALLLCGLSFGSIVVPIQQKDRPLKIKHRTPPDPTVVGNCPEVQRKAGLIVRIIVTFDSSGKITTTELDHSSGCRSFDNEILRVGKKIKYDPEIKDGAPITVTRRLEYGSYEQ